MTLSLERIRLDWRWKSLKVGEFRTYTIHGTISYGCDGFELQEVSGKMATMKGSVSLTLNWVALDRYVLLVALRRERIYLGAYIGAAKGVNYDTEAIGVAGRGSMVWTKLAEIYFKGYGSGPVSPFREEGPVFPDEVSNTDYGLKPPILEIRPLDKHVLVVAVRAPGHTWKAFIGAVKGEDFVV